MKPECTKVVIVTGAARGIGRAVADSYLAAGACVAELDREWSTITPETGPPEAADGRILRLKVDLRNPGEIEAAVAAVLDRWDRVDTLINNAGLGITRPPGELTLEEWDTVINTNLRGTFLMSRATAGLMRENSAEPAGTRGAIVNIASTRAMMSEPNTEAYAASKGGIVALTHALAASYAPDLIRVNSISPGWIETGDYSSLTRQDHQQHWAGRVGRPDDIARACHFLSDPAADFITGINLVVDGGMTRKMIYQE